MLNMPNIENEKAQLTFVKTIDVGICILCIFISNLQSLCVKVI